MAPNFEQKNVVKKSILGNSIADSSRGPQILKHDPNTSAGMGSHTNLSLVIVVQGTQIVDQTLAFAAYRYP